MTTGRINQVSTRATLSRNTHLWSPHKHASHYHNTQTTCAAPCSHQLNALTHFHHITGCSLTWLCTHHVRTCNNHVATSKRLFTSPSLPHKGYTSTQTQTTRSHVPSTTSPLCVFIARLPHASGLCRVLLHTHTNHTNTLRQAVAIVFSPSSLTSHRVTSTNSHHSTSRAPGHYTLPGLLTPMWYCHDQANNHLTRRITCSET